MGLSSPVSQALRQGADVNALVVEILDGPDSLREVPRQPVDSRDHDHVAGPEHLPKLRPCRSTHVLALLDRQSARAVGPQLHVSPSQDGGLGASQPAVGQDSNDRQVKGGAALGSLRRFHPSPAAPPGQAQGLPDPRQGISGEGIGLPGAGARLRQSLTASATTGWRAGLLSLLHACGGVEMGDGGAGQLDGGNGAAGGRQVAQVEGHGLRADGQSGVAASIGPSLEPQPGGGIGPAGVVGLGVPEAGGDGLGRLAVALRQLQGVVDLPDGDQIAGPWALL